MTFQRNAKLFSVTFLCARWSILCISHKLKVYTFSFMNHLFYKHTAAAKVKRWVKERNLLKKNEHLLLEGAEVELQLQRQPRRQSNKRHCCNYLEKISRSCKFPNCEAVRTTFCDSAKRWKKFEKIDEENRWASAKDLAKRWGAIIKKTVSEWATGRRVNSPRCNGRAARKKPYISAKNKNKKMK